MYSANAIAASVFGFSEKTQSFGTSASIAARYRFVEPRELRAILEQFCEDFGIKDLASIRSMEMNRVFQTDIDEFVKRRSKYFAPNPARDTLGSEAADFMAAEAFASLLGLDSIALGSPIIEPIVDRVMRRGARGLYNLGRCQFDKLAQIAVDLCGWLVDTERSEIVLIEAPLGNSVPVAVFAQVFRKSGLKVEIVEWGCPRNDRSLNGRTVIESARDLAKVPSVVDAPFLLFVDDAITGSRYLKMTDALRKALGPTRFGALALRVRFNPDANYEASQIRSLRASIKMATDLGMPFGEQQLPDLPIFNIDAGPPGFLNSALAWGDSAHVAGKRKHNILFYFIDRFEAITRALGQPGESEARDLLHNEIWQMDTTGTRYVIPSDIGKSAHQMIIGSLPPDFFDRIRATAKKDFPHDYVGRAVIGEEELRKRTDWLATCISNAALPYVIKTHAHFLNNAVSSLSQAGFTAGIDKPPRDHDYGLYTVPLASGAVSLHLELVDLIVADAAKRLRKF